MLLGSADPRQQYPNEETFIIQLFTQNRFAEAYLLLKKESPNEPAAQFNLALCYFRSRHYVEALACLDKAQSLLTVSNQNNNLQADQFYTALRKLQNQQNDHLQGITQKYITFFADEARDAIIRLKTDCWLQLGNFSKVIEIAKPIAHKNYLNIANALSMAENQLSI